MIAGNASMANPAGGTMIGNAGNGYAKITYGGVSSTATLPSVDTTAPMVTLDGFWTVRLLSGENYVEI
jgi:hypothetical protein